MVAGCAVPRMLQEPFEKGVYRDILERQEQNIPIDDDKLKKLPALTGADYERLGDTYLSRGQLGMARAKYQKALELEPSEWRLQYKVGTIYLRENNPSEALPYFREMIKHDPSSAYGYEGEGRALLAMKDHEAAEKSLEKAVHLDSSSWKAQLALGMLYDDLGRIDEAIAAYEAALRIRPGEASILNDLGVAYYLRKDYAKSIETLEKALRTARPEDRKRVYNNLGRAYARTGAYPRAVDAFRRGTDLPTAYNNVGVVLLEQDKPAEAAGCFEKAIASAGSYYAAAHDNLAAAEDRARGAKGGGGQIACP
jgi:Tfp pilus assembly protein PilF